MKVYTPDDLAAGDGKEGNATLVAAGGKVYDLSQSKKWINGSHMRIHHAAADLTREIKRAPHGPEVLDWFEMVGTYQAKSREIPSGRKGRLEALLDRHPFFRRHPHPAIVHVPMGLFVVAPVMEIVAVLWGSPCTEWAAYCCILVGLISIPAAIATGYFTWWINYEAGPSPIIAKKRQMAWLALFVVTIAVAIRSFWVAQPLAIQSLPVLLYMAAMVAAAAIIARIGYLGGRLTFPYD